MRNDFELDGKKCHTYEVGDGGPAIFWPTMVRDSDPVSEIISILNESEKELVSYTLFVIEVEDWNNEMSPWHFDAGNGQVFGDGGSETLDWIRDSAIPYVEREFPRTTEFAITGYSLAGLFALWSFYSSDLFQAAGCCSGSLWFEGWDKFADGAKTPENGAVYLSLGGKEPGSGNLLTASIGVQYHKHNKRMEKDPSLRSYTYIQNSGGHFSNPVGRVAKSIVWLVGELSVY